MSFFLAIDSSLKGAELRNADQCIKFRLASRLPFDIKNHDAVRESCSTSDKRAF